MQAFLAAPHLSLLQQLMVGVAGRGSETWSQAKGR